ncbi:MAG: Trm112 family protein [Candidatus Brocadiaceae bacterium]|jgi:uncharacterized protein YbaR (Trm112 family)
MSDQPANERPEEPVLDEALLEILVCPACREPVEQDGQELVCTGCGRRYPVRDGIPVMLVEEATPPQEESEGPDQ